MKTKAIGLLFIFILFTASLLYVVPIVKAETTWTVDDNGPADFQRIQDAVNAATPGDTVYVRNGTYYENIVVSKTVSLVGEHRDATIIDGSQNGSIIRINRADNVFITGFTIRNSGRTLHLFETTGIIMYYCSGTLIEHNMMTKNEVGIYFYVSNGNIIRDNLVTNNFFYGILMDYSPGPEKNIITNNILEDNGFGIGLDTSFGHTISNNIITNSSWNGLNIFSNSHNNTIIENTVIRARNGIFLQESNGTALERNAISNSTEAGIHLLSSSLNNISSNIVKSNKEGIYFREDSINNSFAFNQVSSNTFGVRLSNSENNIFYHNDFINNSHSALLDEPSQPRQNLWDAGYPSGGNYWDDYAGVDIYSGPYQNITGKDGIGDTPYTIASLNLDRYPLVHPTPNGTSISPITLLAISSIIIVVAAGAVLYYLKAKRASLARLRMTDSAKANSSKQHDAGLAALKPTDLG